MTKMTDLSDLTEEEILVAMRAVNEHRITEWRKLVGKVTDIYVARQNADLTEGRGPYVPRGYFFVRAEAEKANEMLMGVMGTANEAKVDTVKVYLTAQDWHDDNQKMDYRK
jgi:hypothetical protein